MGTLGVGLCQTDPAVAGRRCRHGGIPARIDTRPDGHRGHYPEQLDRMGCRWQFAAFELLRQLYRCLHVLRYADRGADYSGVARFGYGQGSGSGAAVGRAVALAAQHAGHPRCAGNEKDGGLRGACHRHGHAVGIRVWKYFLIGHTP